MIGLPPQRADVKHDRVDVARVECVAPRRHEAGQADAGAAAADGVGQLGVRLALLKRRIGEIARMRIEIEGVESVARAGVAVAADAVRPVDLFPGLQLVARRARRRGGGAGGRGAAAGGAEKQHEQKDTDDYVILSVAKDLTMRSTRSFAVCAAQDDGCTHGLASFTVASVSRYAVMRSASVSLIA